MELQDNGHITAVVLINTHLTDKGGLVDGLVVVAGNGGLPQSRQMPKKLQLSLQEEEVFKLRLCATLQQQLSLQYKFLSQKRMEEQLVKCRTI